MGLDMTGIDEVVHVPIAHAEGFPARIAWINRRAAMLGAKARIDLVEVGREPRPVTVTRKVFRDGAFLVERATESRPCVLFRLSCPEPAIALPGWSWAGWIASRRAEKDSVTGAVDAPSHSRDPERPILQETLDRAFDHRGRMVCEHCGTFRNRRMGFVGRDAAGAERVVGSSCVLDHTGHDPKAVLRRFQAIDLLRAEIARERGDEAFGAEVYDWEADRLAQAAARAAADAAVHPVRTIVGAILAALARQGFYARTSWEGKVATEEEVRRLLSDGTGAGVAFAERADAIVAWMAGHRPGYPSDGAAPISIGDYLALDPGFRATEEYRSAVGAPLGRDYVPGEPAALTYVGGEAFERDVVTAYGTAKPVPTVRHVFGDAHGSRVVWETTSVALDASLVPGREVEVVFRVRKAYDERCRRVTVATGMRLAARKPGRAG